MSDTVDDITWQMSMDTLLAAARLVNALPLDQMLRTTEVADSIGPILHPSEYRDAGANNNWEAQKVVIKGAIAFRNAFQQAADAVDIPLTT